MKIGIGYDVHSFKKGRKLILGGVEINFDKGLSGHSDADVLTHSIMDAILGACGLGDIGGLFSDSDMKYKDISSLLLLKEVKNKMKSKEYKIENIDCVLILEKPKIFSYIPEMKKKISKVLEINTDKVNIKATTTEGLGFCGREEGIAAQSIVLLK
ncbi:MAG: 2-C-methyl-D-erythritol 2,4-cyclodiphosphate synthase [Actinobacteria bacterium]|nr:2-C-methyl-D-erythritol 2,4-cyclodiphosphate synthase [Actinomycetota bacterium]